jgi:hypothetical protein
MNICTTLQPYNHYYSPSGIGDLIAYFGHSVFCPPFHKLLNYLFYQSLTLSALSLHVSKPLLVDY